MQDITYAALYVLLGLAALMYTAHQLITHGLIHRATYWLARYRVRKLRKGIDHETAS